MNLKLVTFMDQVQFLVDAETDEEAVEIAVEANQNELLGPISDDESCGLTIEELVDRSMYEIDDVSDMKFLFNIMRRNDMLGMADQAIVFSD